MIFLWSLSNLYRSIQIWSKLMRISMKIQFRGKISMRNWHFQIKVMNKSIVISYFGKYDNHLLWKCSKNVHNKSTALSKWKTTFNISQILIESSYCIRKTKNPWRYLQLDPTIHLQCKKDWQFIQWMRLPSSSSTEYV